MRLRLLMVVWVLFCVMTTSCGQSPEYKPETFRQTIESLIQEGRYADAVGYLDKADPIELAKHDKQGYLAVAEDLIVLPGVYPGIEPSAEDWCFPGTQDAIEDAAWQEAATKFATTYNLFRKDHGHQ